MGEELDKVMDKIREIGLRVVPVYEVRGGGGTGRIHKRMVAMDWGGGI